MSWRVYAGSSGPCSASSNQELDTRTVSNNNNNKDSYAWKQRGANDTVSTCVR